MDSPLLKLYHVPLMMMRPQEQGLPFTVFQPLYIYGPLTAKDCEQWFVDRVIRDRYMGDYSHRGGHKGGFMTLDICKW